MIAEVEKLESILLAEESYLGHCQDYYNTLSVEFSREIMLERILLTKLKIESFKFYLNYLKDGGN